MLLLWLQCKVHQCVRGNKSSLVSDEVKQQDFSNESNLGGSTQPQSGSDDAGWAGTLHGTAMMRIERDVRGGAAGRRVSLFNLHLLLRGMLSSAADSFEKDCAAVTVQTNIARCSRFLFLRFPLSLRCLPTKTLGLCRPQWQSHTCFFTQPMTRQPRSSLSPFFWTFCLSAPVLPKTGGSPGR